MNAKADAERLRVADHPAADAERRRLKSAWPDEFTDGARCAFHQRYPGEREKGGYPKGFHGWVPQRRNAWFAGFNLGLLERQRALEELADE
jgi:hypothetical protein